VVFADLASLPALTVPTGREHSLPSGIQFVGSRWSEIRLLDIAAALEQAGVLPGYTPPPG
jgi:amidase